MLTSERCPILEYDDDRRAKISAADTLPKTLPARCVITFFREVLDKLAREQNCRILDYLHSEIVDIPIYAWEQNGQTIALTMPFATAPGAAGTIEELHAMGCEKFLVCGGAGGLCRELTLGKLVLPTAAVRDEGTSYHYLPPAREVACPEQALRTVRGQLQAMGLPFVEGKTWTTDAFYRETEARIRRRTGEGCLTVEMECAAFFAVAQFYGLPLAQLLYAGDDLSGEQWDARDWNKQHTTRENLVRLSLRLVEQL